MYHYVTNIKLLYEICGRTNYMQNIKELLNQEKRKIEFIQVSKRLKRFCTHITYWELLLLLHENSGDPELGINDYIDTLQSTRLTRLTISNFIKDRISDGDLLIRPAVKKSKKALALSHELEAELKQLMMMNLPSAHRPSLENFEERQVNRTEVPTTKWAAQ